MATTTEIAVRAFQQANNLSPTGILDGATWSALTSNASIPQKPCSRGQCDKRPAAGSPPYWGRARTRPTPSTSISMSCGTEPATTIVSASSGARPNLRSLRQNRRLKRNGRREGVWPLHRGTCSYHFGVCDPWSTLRYDFNGLAWFEVSIGAHICRRIFRHNRAAPNEATLQRLFPRTGPGLRMTRRGPRGGNAVPAEVICVLRDASDRLA